MKRTYELRFRVEIEAGDLPDNPTDEQVEEYEDESLRLAIEAWTNDLHGPLQLAEHLDEIEEVFE